jgi:outer membrane protein assembly factor BamB
VGIRNSAVLAGKACLLVIFVLVGLTVLGCAGIRSAPEGGSGGTIVDGTLYIGSMAGKLVAVNTSDGSRLWAEPLKGTGSAGGLGCAPASTMVAIYGSPAADGNLVYVGGYNGKIYEFDSSTHLSKDRYPNDKNGGPIIGGPLVAAGKVYIGSSDGMVYGLDAVSFDKVWDFATGDKIWSTPAIDGDTLYIGSFDKKLYALNASDGSKKWEFRTEGAIISTPLVYDNTVYIGSFDRHLYAVNSANGELIWQFPAADEDGNKPESWFWAKPVAYNNVIYAGCLDHKVYALDAQTGEKINEFDLGSPIASSPVLVDGKVIIATEKGEIYAIDTINNQKSELKNLVEKVYAPLCTSDGVVYIYSQEQNLHALNAESGAKLWSLTIK